MNIYNKPTDSKRYVRFISNQLRSCLRNIPFCLARRICTIVEEEDKSKTFVRPKNIIKTSKISYCLKKWHKKSFTNTTERIKETYGKRDRRKNTLPLYPQS